MFTVCCQMLHGPISVYNKLSYSLCLFATCLDSRSSSRKICVNVILKNTAWPMGQRFSTRGTVTQWGMQELWKGDLCPTVFYIRMVHFNDVLLWNICIDYKTIRHSQNHNLRSHFLIQDHRRQWFSTCGSAPNNGSLNCFPENISIDLNLEKINMETQPIKRLWLGCFLSCFFASYANWSLFSNNI